MERIFAYILTWHARGIREDYRSDSHWVAYALFLSSVKIIDPPFFKW